MEDTIATCAALLCACCVIVHGMPTCQKKEPRAEPAHKDSKLQTIRNKLRRKPKYAAAWPLLQDPTRSPIISPQKRSPIFSKLSAELRIAIYEDVLTDITRFTHIRSSLDPRVLAHRRCIELDSILPIWQHKCFFRSLTDSVGYGLLGLLLSCRRVYFETLRMLYARNIFTFKGAVGVLAWHASVPDVQWSCIRHVHISTAFERTTMHRDFGTISRRATWSRKYPPDSLQYWESCCNLLQNLKSLDTLRFDLIVRHGDRDDEREVPDHVFTSILTPLKEVKAGLFEVELNVSLSEGVWESLGQVPFKLTVAARGDDEDEFR